MCLPGERILSGSKNENDRVASLKSIPSHRISRNYGIQYHWLGAYRTNALYSGHIFVRFNDLEDVFT